MKDEKIKLRAVYKCRMCGAIFQKGQPVSCFTAYRDTVSLSMMESTLKEDRIRLRAAHHCNDSDLTGLGDFIGFAKDDAAVPRSPSQAQPEDDMLGYRDTV